MAEKLQDYLHRWPNLSPKNHLLTSDETDDYNCAAFAAYDEERNWWPLKGNYWPFEKSDIPELDNFIRYFQSVGYKVCTSEAFEPGFEKVAIYASQMGGVLHVARQDSHCPKSGWWSSKMGNLEDIAHKNLSDLEGDFYGKVRHTLKRKVLR